jgi:hypothetical protein
MRDLLFKGCRGGAMTSAGIEVDQLDLLHRDTADGLKLRSICRACGTRCGQTGQPQPSHGL